MNTSRKSDKEYRRGHRLAQKDFIRTKHLKNRPWVFIKVRCVLTFTLSSSDTGTKTHYGCDDRRQVGKLRGDIGANK
jgi:hypothetical protein